MTVAKMFVCSQCNYESMWQFARCGKCGAHGCCFELKNKRCRACGGIFDSLVDDHPILEDQCAKCVELYEEQNNMSSDMHQCNICWKWRHELDMDITPSGVHACKQCDITSSPDSSPKQYDMPKSWRINCEQCGIGIVKEALTPDTAIDLAAKEEGWLFQWTKENGWSNAKCRRCMMESSSDLSPKITHQAGPGSDHYTAHAITPMEYVKGMGRSEYRGACVLNVIKYVTRFHLKGTPLRDLEKARWYIDQLIEAQAEWDRDSTKN